MVGITVISRAEGNQFILTRTLRGDTSTALLSVRCLRKKELLSVKSHFSYSISRRVRYRRFKFISPELMRPMRYALFESELYLFVLYVLFDDCSL